MSDRLGNHVVYDFAVSPITFDFANFLANARLSLASHGKEPSFHLSLLADKWRNFTRREHQYDLSDRLWRLHNLILPVCSITPAITGLSLSYLDEDRENILNARPEFMSDDRNYLIRSVLESVSRTGYDPHLFASPVIATKMAQKLLHGKRKVALVALRESNFEQSRDTPLEVFSEMAEELKRRGYRVFVIPDQESPESRALKDFPGTLLSQASTNVPLRLALHEQADISICTSSGPTSLLNLAISKPNMVICYPIRDGVSIASEEYFKAHGYAVGHPQALPWTPENQIWLWDKAPKPIDICDAVDHIAN